MRTSLAVKDVIKRKLRALELCVGAGGLALGTARAGFKDITVIDVHGPTCQTLRRNKLGNVAHVHDWNIIEDDISELQFSNYTEIDLLSGGPPCQPFSQAGKRIGRSDEREMFPHFIRAVRECNPKTFIIENVKGLRHRSFLNYFNYIVLQLNFPHIQRRKGEKWTEHRAKLERFMTSGKYDGVRYNVVWQVLNAADYGVAQRRERVFIVGVRADLGIEYSFPLVTHTHEALLVGQWVTGDYWEHHSIPKCQIPECPDLVRKILSKLNKERSENAWKTVRDAIGDLPNVGLGHTSHKVLNHFLNPGARAYKGHDGSTMDAPAKTIKAGHHGVPGGENMVRLDNGTIRYFSVRECARLQAFPDDWVFDGSWCACMRQIGNAVPVTLGEVVAAPLAKALLIKPD
ncbi:MAG TPA: DNA cytosine methyltransferase [Phycisphaerae bacterium]|nr:DNA cytosine methyltransferase [Phycisphaerae bacterium]